MYALIHNSQLLLGPIGWNYRMINSDLEEELELDYRVTKDDWQSVPIKVNDETYILPAKQIIPDYDTRYHAIGNFTWEKEYSDLTNTTSTDQSSFLTNLEIQNVSVTSYGSLVCTIPNLNVPTATKIQVKNLQFDTSDGIVSIDDRTYLVSSINQDGSFVLLPKGYDLQEYINLSNDSAIYFEGAYVVNEVKLSAAIFNYPIHERTLEDIKYQYKLNVKPERKNKENQIITITVNNTEVQVSTSREERDQFVTKLISCSNIENASHNYKFRGDVWVSIGCTEIQYILEQIDHVVQEAFDWELAKIEEIDACLTAEEVYNVVIREVPELSDPLLPPLPPFPIV